MRSSRFGEIPTEISALLDELRDHEERLRTLEAPSGEALGQTVDRVSLAFANLNQYIADNLPEIIVLAVTEQIAEALAGDVEIGGNLLVNGTVTMPNVIGTTFTVEPNVAVKVNTSNGRIGRT